MCTFRDLKPETCEKPLRISKYAFKKLVVEEFLVGEEVSVLALTDGITVRPLLPAQDHKRIGEGDTGNNTGGMGVYAPAPIAPTELMEKITQEVLQPTVETLRKRGIDYRGVLYAGFSLALMITFTKDRALLFCCCRACVICLIRICDEIGFAIVSFIWAPDYKTCP